MEQTWSDARLAITAYALEIFGAVLPDDLRATIEVPTDENEAARWHPSDIAMLETIDHCYTTGRYWMLDYARPFDPPFGEDDAAWIAARLREAGLI